MLEVPVVFGAAPNGLVREASQVRDSGPRARVGEPQATDCRTTCLCCESGSAIAATGWGPFTVPGMASVATALLGASWEASALRLERRCAGLTDEEFLWKPVADDWTVRPDPGRPGRWTYDYDFAPPPPAPVTSISWRLVHLIADNEIYWEYAFGPGQRTSPIWRYRTRCSGRWICGARAVSR